MVSLCAVDPAGLVSEMGVNGDVHLLPGKRRCAMSLTDREFWTLVHGMIFGAIFLLGFAGGLEGLYSLRPQLLKPAGIRDRALRLKVGVVAMAVAAWGTVLTGTWIVYPWYRDPAPDSPRSTLLADEATAEWHHFGMEWKEHIAWMSPILATVVAFIVVYYGASLVRHDRVRRTTLLLFVLAFVFAAVAGLFGALITKAAPII
jgi:hypothetical protein